MSSSSRLSRPRPGVCPVFFSRIKTTYRKNEKKYFPLVEATFLERPARSAEFLETLFLLPRGHALTSGLRSLGEEILLLRKTGEDILVISKDLDKIAREKAETVIRVSQIAILIFFPLFFHRRHRHAVLYQHECGAEAHAADQCRGADRKRLLSRI